MTHELVGTYEAHIILGVERSRLARLLVDMEKGIKADFPEPVARLKCGPVWTRAQIDEYAMVMYRQAGSPYGQRGLERWLRERRADRASKEGLATREVSRVVSRLAAAAA